MTLSVTNPNQEGTCQIFDLKAFKVSKLLMQQYQLVWEARLPNQSWRAGLSDLGSSVYRSMSESLGYFLGRDTSFCLAWNINKYRSLSCQGNLTRNCRGGAR